MTTRNVKKTRSSKAKAVTPKAVPAVPQTKLDQLAALLGRPEGASIAEMMAVTGWQAHSVRGALAGSLKKRGLKATSDKVKGVRRYRIAGQ